MKNVLNSVETSNPSTHREYEVKKNNKQILK
jgi:hypothetical protein